MFVLVPFYLEIMQVIYVDRAGTKDEKDASVSEIAKRQVQAENDVLDWPILTIFPEGTVTNGLNVSQFKRGAFAALRPVQPTVRKYHWNKVSPHFYPGFDAFPLIVSELGLNQLRVTHLPVFVPNSYMFTVYAKTIKGHEQMEKWEIYTHAINEIIREEEGLGLNTQPTRIRLEY